MVVEVINAVIRLLNALFSDAIEAECTIYSQWGSQISLRWWGHYAALCWIVRPLFLFHTQL